MITLLVEPGAVVAEALLDLDPAEARHLAARRISGVVAARITDGRGTLGEAELRVEGRRATARIGAVRIVPAPPPCVLAVGAGDKDRFAAMIEAAAQLGVTAVVPIETERSLAVATRVRAEHLERLVRRGREALKQCGGAWAPEVSAPVPLAEWLDRTDDGLRWVADPDGAVVPAVLDAAPVSVLVGPEGGFTPDESRSIGAAGFQPIRLGPHILRFETAALAAAAAIATGRIRGSHG